MSTTFRATFTVVSLWLDGVKILHFAEHTLTRSDVGEQVVVGVNASSCCLNTRIAREALDATTLLVRHHGDNDARLTGARGAARAVEEGLWLCRWIRMDDERDIIDVNSTSGDVGRDERVSDSS
jgi:hypothetical protein